MILPFLITILSFGLNISLKPSPVPTVLMHGIMSDAEDLDNAKTWFEKHTGGPVYSLEVGNGRPDSIGKPMMWQLDEMTRTIKSIPDLQHGFNFVGFSQGGLLGRGYAELYNDPPVKTLVTLGTPHAGIYYYSVPNIYSSYNQKHFSYAGYWKDPYRYESYLRNASYLPVINGEKGSNEISPRLSVDRFVMVWSPQDGFIVPEESCKFEFYDENSETIVPFRESTQYLDNLIGLRELDETNRLYMVEANCIHNEYKTEKCLESIGAVTMI